MEEKIVKAFEEMAIEELNSKEFDDLLHSFELMESTSNNLFHIRKSIDELRELSDNDVDIDKLVVEVEGIIKEMEQKDER